MEGASRLTSRLVMAQMDLCTVSQLLGHASIEMTQRYAHVSPDHGKMAMEKLEGLFQHRVGGSGASDLKG